MTEEEVRALLRGSLTLEVEQSKDFYDRRSLSLCIQLKLDGEVLSSAWVEVMAP